ncbi:DNA replication protein DnaC [Oxalobacteraceae bacterium GrIS 2.11]
MIQDTLDKLNNLKLFGMAAELERQMANPTIGELPFEHRIRILADQEATFRNNKRLQLLLKKAKLQVSASVEAIDYRQSRSLDKSLFLSLTTLDWINQQTNLVITGPTGTGKTWLACALGNQACRNGLTAFFIRVPMLLDELLGARATGTFQKRLEQLKKIDLLVLDDWAIEPFTKRAQNDLLELIDARNGTRSTIITSQLPMDRWHDAIDNKAVADAILDRIVHSSHAIKLTGDSMRPPKKKQTAAKS